MPSDSEKCEVLLLLKQPWGGAPLPEVPASPAAPEEAKLEPREAGWCHVPFRTGWFRSTPCHFGLLAGCGRQASPPMLLLVPAQCGGSRDRTWAGWAARLPPWPRPWAGLRAGRTLPRRRFSDI